jgi:serine/threonine protein kinase
MKIVDRYQLEEVVGAGTYGKVYRSTTLDTKELYAVKCIPVEKFRKVTKLNEFTKNEIEVLESINHPNIVRYIEKLATVNNTYMVYEFCNGGTLESKIYSQKFLNEKASLRYFHQILSAMCTLSSKNILHRDMKPSNIMLNDDQIKIGDFGFCKPMEDYVGKIFKFKLMV